MIENPDGFRMVVALSYAIAAMEKLPEEWQDKEELAEMRKLLDRIIPDEDLRQQFMAGSRSVLAGEGKPFPRPALV